MFVDVVHVLDILTAFTLCQCKECKESGSSVVCRSNTCQIKAKQGLSATTDDFTAACDDCLFDWLVGGTSPAHIPSVHSVSSCFSCSSSVSVVFGCW